jgi:hypothetical protein
MKEEDFDQHFNYFMHSLRMYLTFHILLFTVYHVYVLLNLSFEDEGAHHIQRIFYLVQQLHDSIM